MSTLHDNKGWHILNGCEALDCNGDTLIYTDMWDGQSVTFVKPFPVVETAIIIAKTLLKIDGTVTYYESRESLYARHEWKNLPFNSVKPDFEHVVRFIKESGCHVFGFRVSQTEIVIDYVPKDVLVAHNKMITQQNIDWNRCMHGFKQ